MELSIGDFFDYFYVRYSGDAVYMDRKVYPAGYFACELLNVPEHVFYWMKKQTDIFLEEFNVFLSARDASSTAIAQDVLERLVKAMSDLPGYKQLNPPDSKGRYAWSLMTYLRKNKEETDSMLDKGSEANLAMNAFLERLKAFPEAIHECKLRLEWAYEEHFSSPPERCAAAYAEMYSRYQRAMQIIIEYIDNKYYEIDPEDPVSEFYGMDEEEISSMKEDDEYEFKRRASLLESVRTEVSFRPTWDPKTDRIIIAEEMAFTELTDFLRMDFVRGLISGHIPRKCANCGRYFLLENGYNIIYCSRPDPNDIKKRPCFVTGPKKTMKEKSRKPGAPKLSEGIAAEYKRAYNRLKKRHSRGAMPEADWIEQTRKLRDLRDCAAREEISLTELKKECDKF